MEAIIILHTLRRVEPSPAAVRAAIYPQIMVDTPTYFSLTPLALSIMLFASWLISTTHHHYKSCPSKFRKLKFHNFIFFSFSDLPHIAVCQSFFSFIFLSSQHNISVVIGAFDSSCQKKIVGKAVNPQSRPFNK